MDEQTKNRIDELENRINALEDALFKRLINVDLGEKKR